jgi:hypothetical protein
MPDDIWAVVERDEVDPGTLGADTIKTILDELPLGGPPAGARWLRDFLGRVRAIYTIRLRPEAMLRCPDSIRAIDTLRQTIREIVGGIAETDDYGFTNEGDHFIWLMPRIVSDETLDVATLDESSGAWMPGSLDLGDPQSLATFLRGDTAN